MMRLSVPVTFCVLLFISHWRLLRADTQALAIGAIIEESDALTRIAFEEALNNANLLIRRSKSEASSVDRLVGKIEYIKKGDSFHASKKACDLVKNGVIAILGPSDPLVANHMIGVCRQLNIPYLQTEWGQWQRADAHTINVHPHYRSVMEAVENFVTQHDKAWSSLALIYADEKSVLKFEPIQSSFNSPITIRQWKINNEEHNKRIMNYLSKSTLKRFIVDIPQDQVAQFMEMAAQYDMTTEHFQYLFTDWDVYQLNVSPLKDGHSASLTCISVLNNSVPDTGLLHNSVFTTKTLPTRVALIYDAITLFTHGLMQLSKSRRIQPPRNISCEGASSWSFGEDLIKAIHKNQVFGLTGKVHLTSGLREDFYMSFLEITSNGPRQYGYWSKSAGFVRTQLSSRIRREAGQQTGGTVLRVTIIEERPFCHGECE